MKEQPTGFRVIHRNYGHWDVIGPNGRMFRIRGGPGAYRVIDERNETTRKPSLTFNTVALCMAYICDELMYELIVAEGQEPQKIESWNV